MQVARRTKSGSMRILKIAVSQNSPCSILGLELP